MDVTQWMPWTPPQLRPHCFAILAGWFAADFAGGVFHFVFDHHASSTHWLTRAVVRDFNEHHDDRQSLERYNRWPATLMMAASGLPFLALAIAGIAPWFNYTFFAGLCITQYAHKFSHSPNTPGWARILQQLGVFISPAAHERHHGDFHRSYGVLNGWSHGFLDLLLGRVY
jgi:ubiquitin-conjugating enzyme E2 variant